MFRREISSTGNSRAFVNDTPVNISILKELGIKMVDIHSQHENLLLANGQFQLQVLDILAQDSDILNSYKKHYFRIFILTENPDSISRKI